MAVRELNSTCEELMRTNVKLREASTLYNRQQERNTRSASVTTNTKDHLSLINARVPSSPRAPAPSPSNSARARRALLAGDDERGGNMTFMTSELS
jgi:hypothetical protein